MFKAIIDPETRLNSLKSQNVVAEENNAILFKKLVSFCMLITACADYSVF